MAKLFRVRPGEGTRVALFTVQYFFLVAMTIASKTARDTYFLSRYDRTYLPLMFVTCAAVVALIAALYARAASRISRTTLMDVSNALFILVLLGMQNNIQGAVVPALYVWVEVIVSLATLQFWMQAADSFDARQAKRLFALIGAGGSLAAFAAGMSLRPYIQSYGSEALLLLVCGAIAASWILGRTSLRYIIRQPRAGTGPEGNTAGQRLDRYLLLIALIVALSAIVTQIVDYQFKMAAGEAISDESQLASFFGRFYAATGIASLFMQLFFTAGILGRFGLRGGLLTLPAMLAASATGFLLNPGLVLGTLQKFADQTFKFTLNNSALELLWLPVSAERRRALKPLVGGAYKAGAEALAGLMTFFLVKQIDFRYLSLVTLVAASGWLVLCLRVAVRYVQALAEAIERREVDLSGLEIDARDPSFDRTVDRELDHPDPLRRLFALELLEGLPLKKWTGRLRRIMVEGTPEEQGRILEIAQNDPEIVPDSMVRQLVKDSGGLSVQAVEVAALRSLAECLPDLEKLLTGPDERIQASAAAAILKIRGSGDELAKERLARLAESGTGQAQSIAIESLWDDSERLCPEKLRAVLATGSTAGRIAAAGVAARRGDRLAIPLIIANLSDARTAVGAKEALATFPPREVATALQAVLSATPPSPHRRGALRVLPTLAIDDAAAQLTRGLAELNPSEARLAGASLLALSRRHPLPAESGPEIQEGLNRLARTAFWCVRALRLMPETPETILLRDHYENQIREIVPGILMLAGVAAPGSPVEQCVRTYESGDTARLPFVLEFIDSTFSSELRARIVPLLEQHSWSEKDAAGRRFYDDLPNALQPAIRERVQSGDPWEACVLSHYAAKLGETGKDTVIQANSPMFSTLEKTILLKSVGLFQNIPAEKLSRVAMVAQERTIPQGSLILREGDYGESMFVVVNGSVRIHRGDRDIAVLSRGDCLGEMALLDSDPRSASATAMEESTLLEISQESFYSVMEAHPEIMHQIMRLLTRRLRDANERLATKE